MSAAQVTPEPEFHEPGPGEPYYIDPEVVQAEIERQEADFALYAQAEIVRYYNEDVQAWCETVIWPAGNEPLYDD